MSDVWEVTRFGARGDGKTMATASLQKALDACAAAGGGVVVIAPGRYLTGALRLHSHVHLQLDAGATLVASERPQDFPPVRGRDEGIERQVHSSLLTGFDLEDVAITGRGVLDGQGRGWWQAYEETQRFRVAARLPREAENPADAPLRWPRPRLINLIRCRNIRIEGISCKDTPFYAVHVVYCEDVMIDGIRTTQDIAVHSSGIVVDSSKRVQIRRCLIEHRGDAVGIKSGYNEDGRRVGKPCEDILILGCHLSQIGSSAVAIGSETAAGIKNVVIDDCVVSGCKNGIHIRSPRGRGGFVDQVRVSNLVLERVAEAAVKITHFYDSVGMEVFKSGSVRRNLELARSRRAPVDEGTPSFRQLVFSGLTIGQAGELALIEGLPERYIRAVILEDIQAAEAKGGISCSMASDVTISNVRLGKLETPAVDAREVERLEVHRLHAPRSPEAPVVWLENVNGAFVHGCDGVGEGWLRQEESRGVTVAKV
jgi:polygalacturonase